MNKSQVSKAYEYIPSEHGEREGEAPSGFAGGGGDVSPLKIKGFTR